MSKVDAQRALREARYAASASGATPAAKPTAAAAKAATPAVKPSTKPSTKPAKQPARVAEEAPATGLCGHRSMNGRSCTRDAGHSEKNHRYG